LDEAYHHLDDGAGPRAGLACVDDSATTHNGTAANYGGSHNGASVNYASGHNGATVNYAAGHNGAADNTAGFIELGWCR